ncbi:copper transporter 1-like protein [Cinnamomum micranthum f. kanehirae]|uniref:Copper transport protein n=1 Tax=Cinnamomum micranthum f. kanehirae TaxID=337451 RepID=A0A443NSR7_9MAGN|nr:copper transporter 1-like protein [Cinnamomum micranthum f. kanehirae]
MGGGADHDHGMMVDGGMFMPETKKKNMMHMTFFWGKDVDMLFSGWPGRSLGMYLLALFFVFALAVMVEWLSHSRFFKQGSNRVVSGLAKTFLHAVRMGLAYLVMLAVMSFNVGVLIAAIIGHAIGFFIFGSRIFSRNDEEVESNQKNRSSLPPLKC